MINLFLTLIVLSMTGCKAADHIPYEEIQLVPYVRPIRQIDTRTSDPSSDSAWKVEGALTYSTPEGVKYMTDFIANFLRSGAQSGYEPEFIPAPQPFPNFHSFFTRSQPDSAQSYVLVPQVDSRSENLFRAPIRVADLPVQPVASRRAPVAPSSTIRRTALPSRVPAPVLPVAPPSTIRRRPTSMPVIRRLPQVTQDSIPAPQFEVSVKQVSPTRQPSRTPARFMAKRKQLVSVKDANSALSSEATAPVLPVAPPSTLKKAPTRSSLRNPMKPSYSPLFQKYANEVTSATAKQPATDQSGAKKISKKPVLTSEDEADGDDDDDDLPPPAALPPHVVNSMLG